MKKIITSLKISSKTLLFGSMALMISASAFAQSIYQWQQGGSSSDWGDAGNWGGSVDFNHNDTFSFYRNATRLNLKR